MSKPTSTQLGSHFDISYEYTCLVLWEEMLFTDRQTDVQTDGTASKAAVSHKLTGSLKMYCTAH